MPLGQKSFTSKLPRRGWVMEMVTATCSRVFSPDMSRSILLTFHSTSRGRADSGIALFSFNTGLT